MVNKMFDFIKDDFTNPNHEFREKFLSQLIVGFKLSFLTFGLFGYLTLAIHSEVGIIQLFKDSQVIYRSFLMARMIWLLVVPYYILFNKKMTFKGFMNSIFMIPFAIFLLVGQLGFFSSISVVFGEMAVPAYNSVLLILFASIVYLKASLVLNEKQKDL